MRTQISTSALVAMLVSGTLQAGGLDRSGQDTSIIFQEGGLFEVTTVSVKPTVSGIYDDSQDTGDVTPDYAMTTLGMRADINATMAVALIKDSPYGADVHWTTGELEDVKAQAESDAMTALVRYSASDAIKVYGGIKHQSIGVNANLPISATIDYKLASSPSSATGYLMGAAFEMPEIALRLALTYHAKIKHTMAVRETITTNGGPSTYSTTVGFYTPSAFNLGFQTGVAANTLLFGSIRRANWTETSVAPIKFMANAKEILLAYDNDTTVYNIGLGRKLNDQWSIAATYGYEKAAGVDGSPLSPTDGNSSYGFGVTYNADRFSVTVGARQVSLGDTGFTAGSDDTVVTMADNKAQVVAVKMAYNF